MPPHQRRGLLPDQNPAGAIDDLETILDRFLTYGQTTTSIVVSTPVPPHSLPITG
jgi:hypothetical protein